MDAQETARNGPFFHGRTVVGVWRENPYDARRDRADYGIRPASNRRQFFQVWHGRH